MAEFEFRMRRAHRKSLRSGSWSLPLAACSFALLAKCALVLELPEPAEAAAGTHDGSGGAPRNAAGVGGEGPSSSGGEGGGNGAGAPGAGGMAAAGAGAAATAGNGGDGSGGCQDACDCDGDGFRSEECGAAGAALTDCDDHDDGVRPDQTDFKTSASENPSVGFDFNCDDVIDLQYDVPLATCPALTLENTCPEAQGFVDSVPSCGDEGSWGVCMKSGVSCTVQGLTARTQGCR